MHGSEIEAVLLLLYGEHTTEHVLSLDIINYIKLNSFHTTACTAGVNA